MPDPKRDGATDANKGRTNPEKEADKGRVTLAGLSRREALPRLAVVMLVVVVVDRVVNILTNLRTWFSPRQVGRDVTHHRVNLSMSARAGFPRATFRARVVPAEPPPTSRAGDRHKTRSV